MRKITAFIIALFPILFPALHGQDPDTTRIKSPLMRETIKNPEGTEFWLVFMQNYSEGRQKTTANELHLELFITSDQDAQVEIECPRIDYRESVFVPGGTVKIVKVSSDAEILAIEAVESGMSVHVTSDNPVSIYALNRRHQTTDTYLGLPTRVLGTEYRAMCYYIAEPLLPEFAVAATEDNTLVTIIPTADTYTGNPAGVPYNVTLNKGDVYQVAAGFGGRRTRQRADLTGSYIKANKKIAVFSGHQCAYVPVSNPPIIACNHLAEQMPPIPSWGKHFFIGEFKKRSFFTYRVLAHQNETKVFENSQLIKSLSAGEFLERTADKSVQLTADKPVLVSQYSQGFSNGDSIGDPMMILISPTQQFLKKYRFATPVSGDWNHYINIVAPTVSLGTLRLDGEPVDKSLFSTLGLSRYSIAALQIPFGTHIVEAAMPFGMYSYGFGFRAAAFDAYGAMGGQSFVDYEPAQDTLAPMMERSEANETLSIIFRDDRVDDMGIRAIYLDSAVGIAANVPKIVEGIPQAQLTFKPLVSNKVGRIVLRAEDVALNTAVYTICYTLNPTSGRFDFAVTSGSDANCQPERRPSIGAFARVNYNIHSTDFSSAKGVAAQSGFSGASATGGYFGFIVDYPWKNSMNLTARAAFENYSGKLVSGDTLISRWRNPETGELLPLQEGYSIELKGWQMALDVGAEWRFHRLLYGVGGLSLAVPLSRSADVRREILTPEFLNYTREQGEINSRSLPKELTTLSSMRFGLFAGVGATVELNYKLSLFSELTYKYFFNSLLTDADWRLQQLSVNLGARYRI
ncbi:MAG: IgGFc-binding protein [Chloroflexota bacterium]